MLHGKCEGVNRKQTGWRHGVSRHYCLTNTKVFFPEISPQMSCVFFFFFEKQENLVHIDVVVLFFLQRSTTDEIREKKAGTASPSREITGSSTFHNSLTCLKNVIGFCPMAWASPMFALITSVKGLLAPWGKKKKKRQDTGVRVPTRCLSERGLNLKNGNKSFCWLLSVLRNTAGPFW